MSEYTDRNYLYILIAFLFVICCFLTVEYIITGYQFGVPLDDTWIHFRFAENFANGHFLEYNIGEPTPGTTSPLWMVLLIVPFFISKSLVLPYALILTSLFLLLSAFQVYRICLKIGIEHNYAFLGGLLTVLNGRLIWSSLSGMEITLFCLLILLIVRIHLNEIENKKINFYTGILLGLSVLARPESYLFCLIYYFSSVFLLRNSLKVNKTSLLISLLLFAVVLSPYPLFSYFTTGKLLPNTYFAKHKSLTLPDSYFMYRTLRYFLKDNFIVFFMGVSSVVYFFYTVFKKKFENKLFLIFTWVFVFPIFSACLVPLHFHYGRYLMPVIPFLIIMSIDFFCKTFKYLKKHNPVLFKTKKAVYVLLILLSVLGAYFYSFLLAKNVDNINDQQIEMGKWINQNLASEEVIAVNDIGVIAYITHKKIIDMEGLVYPEILQFKNANMENQEKGKCYLKILKKNKVSYIIIYLTWYEDVFEKYYKYMDYVYSIRLENNTICGADEMSVLKINWDMIDLN